jgi:hypothetical protein
MNAYIEPEETLGDTDYMQDVADDIAQACPPWGAELLVAAVAAVSAIVISALGVWP